MRIRSIHATKEARVTLCVTGLRYGVSGNPLIRLRKRYLRSIRYVAVNLIGKNKHLTQKIFWRYLIFEQWKYKYNYHFRIICIVRNNVIVP